MQQLADGGCFVIAYDQRFHGASDSPPHGTHVSRLAADLRDVLAALQLRDGVTLVGTSMGAAVIFSYVELFGLAGLAGAVFVDQAPLQNRAHDWSLGSKGCYDAATLGNLQVCAGVLCWRRPAPAAPASDSCCCGVTRMRLLRR